MVGEWIFLTPGRWGQGGEHGGGGGGEKGGNNFSQNKLAGQSDIGGCYTTFSTTSQKGLTIVGNKSFSLHFGSEDDV